MPVRTSSPSSLMKRSRKNITIQDVAQAAGVSVSTVSRVLNNKNDVALETLAKIQCVIKELGYASSLAARGMRSHHTHVIGLILPDVQSPYCFEIMKGVNQVIAGAEYDLIIYTNGASWHTSAAEQETYYVNLLNGNIVDGVIVVTPTALKFGTDAPLVIIDPNNENPNLPGVLSTNYEGAREAIAYLTGLGHRRIGHITGRSDLVSARQRLQGYKDGLAAAGIPLDETLVQTGDYFSETAVKCAEALLALDFPPTAIFAANDQSAIGIYRAAAQAGVRIPQDLSVIGFDNLLETAYLNPPLTTIDQFIAALGTAATEMILKLVNGESLDEKLRIIPTRLVVRESCRCLA
jgi:LacI family transcriptional regulator